MPKNKEVQPKKYPPDFTLTNITKGMIRTSSVDFLFHLLMAILLITGLIIDLLGPWLGGSLLTIRSVAHGYVGVLFIIVFIVYMLRITYSKKMKMVLTQTNFVDFVFYIILIVTGIMVAAANSPWIEIAPWLSEGFSLIGAHPQALHVTLTYIWVLISLVTPSGLLHGFACTYLYTHLRRSKNK